MRYAHVVLLLVGLSSLSLAGCGGFEALRRDARSAAESMAKIEVEERKIRLALARRQLTWDAAEARIQQLRKGNNHLMRLMAPHEENRRLFLAIYQPLEDRLVYEAMAREGILDDYYREFLKLNGAPARAPAVPDERVTLVVHQLYTLTPAGLVEAFGATVMLLPLPLLAVLLFRRDRKAAKARTADELRTLKTFLRRVRFTWKSGEVIDLGIQTATTISGGGSTRYSNGAYSSYTVDPIRSRSHEIADIWIRERDSGEEFSIRTVDSSFRVRRTQDIVTVWAAPGRRAGWLVYLGNLTTGSGTALALAPGLVRGVGLHVAAPWLALTATPGVVELMRRIPAVDMVAGRWGAVVTWVTFLALWIGTYKAIHAYAARAIRKRAHAIAEHCVSERMLTAEEDEGATGPDATASTLS